ncbi:MAG TPA: FliG C-terminal domain-containing protein [Bacteriovoracaceae bacterium]|nr:FliG C-terminal domain-containing protein [Bacteriovoracaceae bacterium]
MLDRIKKKQFEGFKEFVQSMEITGSQTRVPIFTAGILEDPLFMGWVMKNIMTFEDFLKLPSDEIESVLKTQDQMMGILAKCIYDPSPEVMKLLESSIPRFISKLKDELSYLTEVSSQEKDSARFHIVKVTRKMQMQELIQGFPWKLPAQDVFFSKTFKDGLGQIMFENGVLAAEGNFSKGKRSGSWRHNYETGNVLAEGDYLDGLKAGNWVFYYGSGGIKAQGKYKADLRHGPWKEFDRNGKVTDLDYVEGSTKKIGV